MKWRSAVWLVAMLVGGSGMAQVKSKPIFPAEVADSVWWSSLGEWELPLWRPVDRAGYQSRIRLSIAGIARLRIVIRIDEDLRGKFKGRALLIETSGGRPANVTEYRFRPNAQRMAALNAKIIKAGLWTIYPEHWVSENDDICVDGEQLVFERADENGYRFSEVNAQCTAPSRLLEVARMMIEISGVPRGAELLN